MTRWMLLGVLWLLLLTCSAQASDWVSSWDVQPELGAGTTIANGLQVTVSLGLKLGTFSDSMVLVPNRDFGVDLAQVNSCTALGGWVGLTKIGSVDVRTGLLIWKDEKPKGDWYVRAAKTFALTW